MAEHEEQAEQPSDPFTEARRRADADAFAAMTLDEQTVELTRRLKEETAAVNVFDVIKAKGWEIAEFHAVTNGVTYTEDDRAAIDIGLSCGVHAAIEHYATPPRRPDAATALGESEE